MELLIPLILGAIIWTIFSKLAERKNRSGGVWGALTGIPITAFLFSLIHIPSFIPYKADNEATIIVVSVCGTLSLFIISAIVLAFLPPICVECNKKLTRKQWKNKECPQCRKLEAELITGNKII